MKTTRRLDVIAGLGFVTIAALIIWVAIPYGVQEPKKVKFVALSPSYYPRLVGYCLLAFGGLLVLSRWLKTDPPSIGDHQSNKIRRRHLVLLTAVALTLLFYYLSLNSLGFVVASAIVLLVLLLLAGERNIVAIVLIPLILPAALYAFFTHVANIPIPSGILAPLLNGA